MCCGPGNRRFGVPTITTNTFLYRCSTVPLYLLGGFSQSVSIRSEPPKSSHRVLYPAVRYWLHNSCRVVCIRQPPLATLHHLLKYCLVGKSTCVNYCSRCDLWSYSYIVLFPAAVVKVPKGASFSLMVRYYFPYSIWFFLCV